MFLVSSGVLFADAGKSKHPHPRSKKVQESICEYAKSMVVLWLRTRATISKDELKPFLEQLTSWGKLIAQAMK